VDTNRRAACAAASRRVVAGLAGLAMLLSTAACSFSAVGAPDAPQGASGGPASASPAAVRPTWSITTGDVGAPVATPDKAILGAYIDLLGKTTAQSLALRRQQTGRDPRILQFFYQWSDKLPSSYPTLPQGAIPMLTWRGIDYADILNGSQDTLIGQQADRLAKYGKPVFLRWAWEMNGSWYAWGGTENGNNPANFVLAWQHLHQIFVAHKATNVGWVWAPNWESNPREAWNDFKNYYPGDDYVDWVGISGYGDSGLTPEVLYGAIYNTYASHKPIMLAEVGAIDRGGSTKADWINAMRDWVKSHPSLAAVVWYDTDHSPGTKENFRADSSPGTLDAYRQLSNDPYFGG
jgi:hypothetical protein